MKSIFASLFIGLLLAITVQAQEVKGRLDLQLNKNILQPGDSLRVTINYKDGSGTVQKGSLATLELIIENEQGQRTRLRWPVIEGQASGALYLPNALPQGKYTILAGLQQRFFEVIGKVEDTKKISRIQAMLLTKSGDWAVQEIPVEPNSTFEIRNWLFEENGLLAFSDLKDNSRPLNISISTQLDSTNAPIAVAGKYFYVGNPTAAAQPTLQQPLEVAGSVFTDVGAILPAVVVRTTAKSRAERFNEEYVSGLFKSSNERLLNVMDDPAALSSFNIFNYLQGRVAGLQITQAGFNGGMAIWRGSRVTFFLDEVRVSGQQIANIPMADISIVKAYPSPFIGAPGGGAAIAIYTRRGGSTDYLPPNTQVFKVKGYTPSAVALDMNKLSL